MTTKELAEMLKDPLFIRFEKEVVVVMSDVLRRIPGERYAVACARFNVAKELEIYIA